MTYQLNEILLDKYRIEELLGTGAFGEVYRVTHLGLKVPRALKVLRSDAPGIGSSDYLQLQSRFQLEAQLGALLNSPTPHPNLLQVHDCYLAEDVLLLEMEYAPGGDLAQKILEARQAGTPWSVAAALRTAEEIALGLAVLHANDVVHRDLKPGNVLFDNLGHAKVADMSLAQMPHGPSQRSQLSTAAHHPGTVAYMSPEQAKTFGVLKPSSDVYTLGLVLFEMLTGQSYTYAQPASAASKLRTDLPVWLDQLLLTLLAESPQERPWDGAEAAEMLHAAAEKYSGREQEQTEQARQAVEETERKRLEQARLEEDLRKKKVAEYLVSQAAEETERKRLEQARLDEDLRKTRAAEYQARQAAEEIERKRLEQTRLDGNARPRKPGEEIVRPRQNLSIQLAPGVMMDFVRVPAGVFLMGSDQALDKNARHDELPQGQPVLEAYLIGKYPVTNRQYQVLAQAIGLKWSLPAGKENHPVVNVSWSAAEVFCEWVSHKSGMQVRLPSEAEWEKAARGVDGRIYPWGDQAPERRLANYNGHDTSPVGRYSPQGDSPYACADMAGNVWEWVGDRYKAYPGNSVTNADFGEKYRVLRGGSWYSQEDDTRSASRFRVNPGNTDFYIGFRCACFI